MLEGYELDQFGILKQLNPKTEIRDYGIERNNYGQKSHYLSYLRLGFLKGYIQEFTSILDVGYGNGDFLRACQRHFSVCAGYDLIDTYLPEGCVKETDLLANEYDVITFYDALEHFEDIYFLEKLKCKYVVISLPNCKHPTDSNWLAQWKHLKPNEHLYHMNKESLTALLVASGYKVECVSYYEDIIRRDKNLNENILTIIGKK